MLQDFIANIYELWGGAYIEGFSDDMYAINVYYRVFIWMLISVGLICVTYYYIINHPRSNRWFWWLIVNILTSFANFAISFGISHGQLFDLYNNQNADLPYDFMTHFFPFSIISFCWTFVLFFLFSMIIKWGSKNCKHSPIL